jgi:hypothetical protein
MPLYKPTTIVIKKRGDTGDGPSDRARKMLNFENQGMPDMSEVLKDLSKVKLRPVKR